MQVMGKEFCPNRPRIPTRIDEVAVPAPGRVGDVLSATRVPA
jgi:hypothetical protein